MDLDKVNGKFIGMRRLYEDFAVEPGQTLMFVYVGGFDMNVCIFGFDDAEITILLLFILFRNHLPSMVILFPFCSVFEH